MKERPIIFSSEMVKAILEGRKTQTRRVIKLLANSESWRKYFDYENSSKNDGGHPFREIIIQQCPYGQVGDRLWVRERFAYVMSAFGQELTKVFYAEQENNKLPFGHKWRPSIHMPRWASRLTLEITDIRVEQIRDMTTEDAIAEGMTSELAVKLLSGKGYLPYCIYVGGMKMLWNTLHKKLYRWEDNCWVWVITFRRITQ